MYDRSVWASSVFISIRISDMNKRPNFQGRLAQRETVKFMFSSETRSIQAYAEFSGPANSEGDRSLCKFLFSSGTRLIQA